jgi:uncharacterized protein involved in exopolysaccharide biosynthesis
VSLLLVLTGGLVTLSLPKVYMASSVIRVKQETPDVPVWSNEMMRYDPLYLRTQFEIIQSRPVIEEVVRRLNLNEKLGRAYGYLEVMGEEKSFEQTVKILSESMRVQQYRDTNLIEIQIELSEPKESAPQEAARVANAVADVYRTQNSQRSREQTQKALKALHDAMLEQEKVVAEKEDNVSTIRDVQQIDLIGPADETGASLTKMRMARLAAEEVRVRLQIEDKKARFDKVMNLTREKLLPSARYLMRTRGRLRTRSPRRRRRQCSPPPRSRRWSSSGR